MKALIPVKGQSSRVESKNTRNFAGSSLLCVKINQLQRVGIPVVVNSESDFVLGVASRMECETVKRQEYYATDRSTTSEFYYNVAETFPDEDILFVNCTNPLVSDDTIRAVIDIYKMGVYNSVNTVHVFKEFLLDSDGNPVNYKKDNQPGSQDLPKYYVPTFAVNAISRKEMMNQKNVIGSKPYFYETNQLESIDIDTPLDFEIAQWLYLKTSW
jgi:CMP-N,N'-diacetyllegionaminic acid synthase